MDDAKKLTILKTYASRKRKVKCGKKDNVIQNKCKFLYKC